MSTMGETKYLLHAPAGRNSQSQHPQDLTPCPYSAVSSFNLPSYCDSTLITPVSTQSPSMAIKAEPVLRPDKDIKLSPSTISPTYHFLASDDDYSNGRYGHNPPMKHKSPSGTLHMASLDSSFPTSPYAPEPFFGAYGVSATPVSGRSDSSPSLNPSPPHLHSAGGLSTASSSLNRPSNTTQGTSNYRPQTQAPILIAPNPSSLRPATKQEGGPYRNNSLQSTSTAPNSTTASQGPFSESLGSLPPRGKKRKSPCRDSREKDMVLSGDKTMEEELLLDLTLRGQHQWKEVQKRFNEATGKNMNVAALQMRKKRLIERLRIWTEDDERALSLAVDEFDKNRWETISVSMLKYGCVAKWPKELCQRKWHEMHPEEGYLPQYEMSFRHRDSEDWGPDDGTYSDGRASVCHSLHEVDSGVQMSAISSATMDEVRSRAASDASSQMLHMRRQQQMMFEQQHSGWGPEN